jgi:5'(3')-deoxyribonucleotidase
MKYYDIKEGVGRITKQNQTVDVGPNEISIQAAKFGNKVDKDGRPANMKKKVKGSKTNVLFNLGMTESVDNLYESVLYYRQMKENLGEIAQATEIYVDMDGVLADFFGEWAKLMKVDHFSKIDKEHKIGDALQAIRDKDDFWLNLPLLPQAKQLLSVIKQIKGEYNICSSPLADDPNSEPHKREWIKKNLAFFPPKQVIITSNKPEYATQQDGTPNILIDDFGKNVDAWEAAGGTAFKYKDHKFERTANAIKQHMQEPVTEDNETNKKTQDAATQKAKPYDMPIRRDIADLIMQAYPERENIWVKSDQYGIVGTKLKNGPDVLKLQRQLKKDGYPINVDGEAGEKTDKMFKHWLGNVIYYIKHDYLGESVVKEKVQPINEAFDTQVDWEMDDDMTQGDGEAFKANIGNKEVGIQYYFEVIDAGGFVVPGLDITFEVNGTTKKTGGGDASTIFGAVINHIKQFINQHDEIDAIQFSASKEQGLSRTRLYSAMVDKLSQGTDWINAKTISKADKSIKNADMFKLVRRSAVNDKMVGIEENFADGNKLIVKADNGKVFDISNLPGTLQEKIDSFKDSIKKVYSKSKASVPSFKFYLNDKFIGSMDHIGNVYKENFADGKKKGKSRPGRVKRSGASCNGSVTELRKKAKKASGERAKMYHWCANMKSGRS